MASLRTTGRDLVTGQSMWDLLSAFPLTYDKHTTYREFYKEFVDKCGTRQWIKKLKNLKADG